MRPTLLDPLFAALTSLPSIGPKVEKLFNRLLGRESTRVLDLLFHMPSGAVDRRNQPKLRDALIDSVVTVSVRVDRHRPAPPGRSRAPHLIYTSDDTGDLTITYFGLPKNYVEKLYPVGAVRYVSGTVALYDGMLQMVHPDRVVDEAGFAKLPLVESTYPLTEGLSLLQVRKSTGAAIERVPQLPEWQDESWLRQQEWPTFTAALARLHHPDEPTDVQPDAKAWSRLAYDELLASQLALSLVRAHMRRPAGQRIADDGRLRNKVIAALPYRLTKSQLQAIDDITADLGKPTRMLRLLQGDVGSGKTVVALLASAAVIEARRQAALMAPTELLARQHYATITPLAQASGVMVAILTGRERGPDHPTAERDQQGSALAAALNQRV